MKYPATSPSVWRVSDEIDLIYSPDDEFHYFQNCKTNMTSQPFYFKNAAIKAFEHNEIDWQE